MNELTRRLEEDVTSNLEDRLFNETRMATYIGAYCNAKHLWQTARALAFAEIKHAGQYRKIGHSGEQIPYIYHPLLMTCHAIALGLDDDDLLSASLLHDVCEDCGVAVEELPVSEITKEAVRLLSKPKGFQKTKNEEEKYYNAIAENRIAAMVKLLDRCNNISGMAACFSDVHMAEYSRETLDYIRPLMEKARNAYPEYGNALFLIRYHMNSVLEALRQHMRTTM